MIVVDDGSTDGTYEQIERVAARVAGDARYRHRQIQLLRVENGGKARALNTALGLASGESS